MNECANMTKEVLQKRSSGSIIKIRITWLHMLAVVRNEPPADCLPSRAPRDHSGILI
jgi:hypothetical protein